MADDTELRRAGYDPIAVTCPGCRYQLSNLNVVAGHVRCPECGVDWPVVPAGSERARRRPPSLRWWLLLILLAIGFFTVCMLAFS